jgi:hypothetical protein
MLIAGDIGGHSVRLGALHHAREFWQETITGFKSVFARGLRKSTFCREWTRACLRTEIKEKERANAAQGKRSVAG